MTYHVDFFGSLPDEDNDDCWMGEDYATLEEARIAFNTDPMDLAFGWVKERAAQLDKLQRLALFVGQGETVRDTAFVVLHGPDITTEIKPNPHFSAKRRARVAREHEVECRRERAMEAGMLHGVEAYNEALEG